MIDREKLSRLEGWALRGWSLVPGQLLTFDMIRFRPGRSDESSRIFAKLSFVSPSSLEFVNISRDYGEEIEIDNFETKQVAESYSFEISTSRNGTIKLTAQDVVLCLF
jgi:hypothetical protein